MRPHLQPNSPSAQPRARVLGMGVLVGLLLLVFSVGARPTFLGALALGGLVALAVTLATYLPYFWQETRFLMTPTILLNTARAVALVRLLLARSRTPAGAGLAFQGAPAQ